MESRDRSLASRLLDASRMLKTISLFSLLAISTPALAGNAPVVGGTAVPLGAYPDVVVVLAATAACSGTLIASDVVLTAGHCIGIKPEVVIIDTIDYGKPGGEVIKVKSATAYPSWQTEYDVGILVLETPAKEKPGVVASTCTATEHLMTGAPVRVVGFGLTTKSGTGSNTSLHTATMPVDDATCTTDPSCAPAVAPGGEFTAGGDGTDACFGDSGGPIYVDTDQGPSLIGVVSRGLEVAGTPCGNGGVYVRADKVVAWIEKETGRTIARSKCDDPADGPGDGLPTVDDGGGCSAGAGVLGGGILVVIAALWILTAPRRREARAPR